jgi:hypothetical protein
MTEILSDYIYKEGHFKQILDSQLIFVFSQLDLTPFTRRLTKGKTTARFCAGTNTSLTRSPFPSSSRTSTGPTGGPTRS